MSAYPRLVKRRNGRYYWVSADGFFAPFVAGGAPDPDPKPDDDDDDDDDDDEDEDPDGDPPASGAFTQEQVNRFLAKERKKTRRSVEKEFVASLGMPITDAATALKALADGQKPEAQAAFDRRARELDDREKALDVQAMNMVIREKLQEAGVMPARLKRAVKLVELDDEDPDEDDILTAIEELKTDMPELFALPKPKEDDDDFEEPKPTRRKTPPSNDPPRPPRQKKVPEDAYSLGAAKAAQFSTSFS